MVYKIAFYFLSSLIDTFPHLCSVKMKGLAQLWLQKQKLEFLYWFVCTS